MSRSALLPSIALLLAAAAAPPAAEQRRLIAGFEDGSPFEGGAVVAEHAAEGRHAVRIDSGWIAMHGRHDWRGFDYLKAEVFNPASEPAELLIELRDDETEGYWTRVNYQTVVPAGRSTFILPVKQMYVGEKSRPGRMLKLEAVTRVVFGVGAKPLFLDDIRLERDVAAAAARFDGLLAFDFGKSDSPVMEGFTQVTRETRYGPGQTYGLKDARVWRDFDVLQPEPLYQDFICIESGGFAVDVPNGRYRVVVNIDNPSGYWGEYQKYRRRAILAEGAETVVDTLDFAAFAERYFRSWDSEDLPDVDVFAKYQQPYYDEKSFEVEVRDGRLDIGFQGENWACSLSSLIAYPASKAAEGEAFLKWVDERRRFHFENYFKKVLPEASGGALTPGADDRARGYALFVRDWMEEVGPGDTPRAGEAAAAISCSAHPGEMEPATFSVVPLRDLGRVTVSVGELEGASGARIPADAVDIGFVSYRLSRQTMEGSVYTVAPRLLMPMASVVMPQGVTRRFWLTVRVPAGAVSGVYRGTIGITAEQGEPTRLPLEVTVRTGRLDEPDIPAGPWYFGMSIPWFGDDPQTQRWDRATSRASLERMRAYGFTMCSGMPSIHYRGFRDGKPDLDFSEADRQMREAKELGFLAVNSYGAGVRGFDPYYRDQKAMRAAGFDDYAAFLRAVYGAVQAHAEEHDWLPVYWNLGDEPQGDDVRRAAENSEAYRAAFPDGPPYFTFATSFKGGDRNDIHYRLSKAPHVPALNLHDEPSVRLLQEAGTGWAFYNGGNRWTYGDYMFKAVKEFGMRFRISWHWNVVAGDPYYALDCREDDYAWCNAAPDGTLIPSLDFERHREGLDDYRRLLTLSRLAKERAGTPEAAAAERLIAERMASFKLGERGGKDDYAQFRAKVDDALDALQR